MTQEQRYLLFEGDVKNHQWLEQCVISSSDCPVMIGRSDNNLVTLEVRKRVEDYREKMSHIEEVHAQIIYRNGEFFLHPVKNKAGKTYWLKDNECLLDNYEQLYSERRINKGDEFLFGRCEKLVEKTSDTGTIHKVYDLYENGALLRFKEVFFDISGLEGVILLSDEVGKKPEEVSPGGIVVPHKTVVSPEDQVIARIRSKRRKK